MDSKTISPLDKLPNYTKENLYCQKITYTYDSMNRRVARTDENGTTQYLYGNPNHPFQLTAVRSPLGSLSRYHYDDFGLLFALERHNNWYYITTDQLGTPRVVCDADGELVKVLEYDSFGQVMADSNPEFELHINFAGGLIDGETELVRFGFRDYDAVAGKWTAKDPIGFAGGDGNLYGYVWNEPVNLLDPLGLNPIRGLGGSSLPNWRRVTPVTPPSKGRPPDNPTDPRGNKGDKGNQGDKGKNGGKGKDDGKGKDGGKMNKCIAGGAIFVGVVTIGATFWEDIVTLGAGIWNDIPSLTFGSSLIQQGMTQFK